MLFSVSGNYQGQAVQKICCFIIYGKCDLAEKDI
jgi:hypothetical protein